MSRKLKAYKVGELSQNFRRRLAIFFNRTLPFGFKAMLFGLIALLLVTYFVLANFKPLYLERMKSYGTRFMMRQVTLDNAVFRKINIVGNKRVSGEAIVKTISSMQLLSQQKHNVDSITMMQNIVDELKTKQPWIHHVTLSRTAPEVLNVTIVEYQPFAIWQSDDDKYIIDKDGNTVPYEESDEFKGMVILSGVDANLNAKSLFNIFVIDPELSRDVYSATWVGNRRWDIRLSSGLLVKLPEKNISKAWSKLIKIYRTPGSLYGLRMIDLRVEEKVYLKYDDAINKEIQQL